MPPHGRVYPTQQSTTSVPLESPLPECVIAPGCFFPGTSSSPAERETNSSMHSIRNSYLFSPVSLCHSMQKIFLMPVPSAAGVHSWSRACMRNSREPACVMPHAFDNLFNFSAFLCSSSALHLSSKHKGPRCCCHPMKS